MAIRGAVALAPGAALRSRPPPSNTRRRRRAARCWHGKAMTSGALRRGADGRVAAENMAAAIDDTTALVTIIHAQNEIGTLQPVAGTAGDGARRRGALVHADAAQSLGKVPVDVDALGVDLLSIAGHKLYAPKGVGALYIRSGVPLPPLLAGAGQELRPPPRDGERRLFRRARRRLPDRGGRACRTRAVAARPRRRAVVAARGGGARDQTCRPSDRAAAEHVNVLFPGLSGREVLAACPGVFASTGSACHADREDPSAVLTALGIAPAAALGAIRLSLGRATTAADVASAAEQLAEAWRIVSGTALRQARVS